MRFLCLSVKLGAYDQHKVYDYLQQRQIQHLFLHVLTPLFGDQQGETLVYKRSYAVLAGKIIGLAEWKKHMGDRRRGRAETAMFRLKTIASALRFE